MRQIFLTYFLLIGASLSVSAQCYDDWSQTRPLIIVNPSVTDAIVGGPASFTMRVDTLLAAGKLRSDGLDLRITDDQCVDVAFTADSAYTGSTNTIWMTVPNIPPGDSVVYQLYYGNPGADSSVMNGDGIFTFFDDFSGDSLDTGKWEFVGGYETATTEQGILKYASDRDSASNSRFKFMRSKMSFTDSVWVEFLIEQNNSAHFGFSSADTMIERYLIRYPGRDTMRQTAVMTDTVSNGYASGDVWPDIVVPWRKWSRLRTKLYIDSTFKLVATEFHNLSSGQSQPIGKTFTQLEMSAWHFIVSTFAQNFTVKLDYIRMWPATSTATEALISAGEEVTLSGPSNSLVGEVLRPLVFPNPTTGRLYLPQMRYESGFLSDAMGRILIQWKGAKEQLDVSSLPTGVYLIRFVDQQRVIGLSRVMKM